MTAFPTPSIVTSRRVVPNQFPVRDDVPYRIALIGEAPGEHEENYGIPFVGVSGNYLNAVLSECGLDRRAVFCGNVCQVRPQGNNIGLFTWDGDEIQSGIRQLTEDINNFDPHLCVLLGNTPLHLAKANTVLRGGPDDDDDYENEKKKKSKYPFPVTAWRGSLFDGNFGPFVRRKCLATLHPAFILRKYAAAPLFRFDLTRASQEGKSPTLTLPQRELITSWPAPYLTHVMDTWPSGQRCSLDIEGGLGGWPCVSICARPTKSITIAWGRLSELEHRLVLLSFAKLMARVDVPKVLQNSLYDNFVLSYGYGIPIRNVVEDTMLKGWEVYCELPKSLGVQTSVWTREPYYKAERKSDDSEVYFQYCAKDSAVTLEICQAQDSALSMAGRLHYDFNVRMLNPLLYMEVKGIKYDTEKAQAKAVEVRKEIVDVASRLSDKAGADLRGAKGSLSSTKLAACMYQKTESFTGTGKRRTKDEWRLTPYPAQYKKEAGRNTEKLTTDVEAILNLSKKLPGDSFLADVLKHRHLEGLLETLAISTDGDGRVRCGYNVVGTETGRLTCYTSPTGSGANLTTITKQLRGNYTADPGYDFCQVDLAGADGWTVAAHCKRLGDPTMWDDYIGGLKPAKILCLLYLFGTSVNLLGRDSLLFWTNGRGWKSIESVLGEGFYDCAKPTTHGSNYLMGIPTLIKNILLKSFKYLGSPIYLEHSVARTLQNLYFTRYHGVLTWHKWCESVLVSKGELTSASGHTRVFFGRRHGRDLHETVKEVLADEPQQNTTYATNLAMLRLWDDPSNRVRAIRSGTEVETCDGAKQLLPQGTYSMSPGSLLIQPLHQVHDALCAQWPIAVRDWARGKMKEYFNNELTIAGTKIVIPYEGTFGPSWGDMPNKL